MILFGIVLALAWPNGAGAAPREQVVLNFSRCPECTLRAVGVSVWDEGADRPLIPEVVGRARNQVILALGAGYYRVWARTKECYGDRYLGVLPGHDRRFDVRMQCSRREKGKPIAYIRLVDAMRGLAGTIPRSAKSVSMWPADGEQEATRGIVSRGAYYFDEVNCASCVVRVNLVNGSIATIGIDLKTAANFTLSRRDISSGALTMGEAVHGSPFNAPETLVEGPEGTIWALDRLGNRVVVIGPGSRKHELELPTAFADAGDILSTAHFVWVTERRVGKIVRFGMDGSQKEFVVMHRNFMTSAFRAILGRDNRIWFTNGWDVSAMSETGAVMDYRAHMTGSINDLAVGSDGHVWIAGDDSWQGKGGPFLAALSSDNDWQRFAITFKPVTMRASKGGFWIADRFSALAFVNLNGVERSITLPVDQIWPKLYTVDNAGNIWLTDRLGNMLVYVETGGNVSASYTEFEPAGISDIAIAGNGAVWIAEPKAHVVEEYKKGFALPPRGINPKYLLLSSGGVLWYSDPDSDVVGVLGNKSIPSLCYALRLSHVKSCGFGRIDILSGASLSGRKHRAGFLYPAFTRLRWVG